MDIYELKQYIPEYAERMLKKAKGGLYVCPFCGSGEKRNRTGALKIYGNGYKCFSCGRHGDLFDLMSEVEQLSFTECLKRAEMMFGNYSPKQPKKKARKTNVRYKYKDYIERCQKDVSKAKKYLKQRGFSKEDADRFMVGYDQENNGIVIPYGRDYSYYLWRSVNEKRFDKPKADEAGPEPIYNKASLSGTKPCFICESPIDAMSVMIASEFNAIALGGTGVKKLIDYIDTKDVKAPLIVSLDDDDNKERNVGLENAKILMGELMGRRIPFVFARYSKDKYPNGQYKDANEMLVANREAFEQDLIDNAHRAKLMCALMENNAI